MAIVCDPGALLPDGMSDSDSECKIIVLDSLKNKPRMDRAIKQIYGYLKNEADSKLGNKVLKLAKSGQIGAVVPQQNNSFDCGMYLLQFFEDFIMQPVQFIEKIQKEGYVFEHGKITDNRKKMIEIFNQLSENKFSF
jgi:Ulp1 family protease